MVQNFDDTTVDSDSSIRPSWEGIGPKGKSILVTGGGGFIGSHVVDSLVEHNEVRVLDNFTSGFRSNVHPDATVIEGDMRNEAVLEEAMAGADIVFHEAALVSVTKSIEAPKQSHEMNVSATVDVLDHARREDARVVLASSAAIYGAPQSLPISEDHPKNPMSPYGLDKLMADRYARFYHEQYGLETVTLRYFNAYGPRQVANAYSGVVSIFIDQAQNGEPITVEGDGSQTRDFIHVSDIVQANLRAATADVSGEAFNVGTGNSITIQKLANVIHSIVDSKSEVYYREVRSDDISQSRADISKIESMLGYGPTVDLQTGLETLSPENKSVK
ncbi:NAD-dependent epimerase/dehydratase family protein [Halalkalicoccus sp. GCM10025322]|uniref:NAD-dependent epimerase/dehydratase family protein n=1 Tax=Halalkalicoccus TaxID=332246 RepID=UPI002F96A6F3